MTPKPDEGIAVICQTNILHEVSSQGMPAHRWFQLVHPFIPLFHCSRQVNREYRQCFLKRDNVGQQTCQHTLHQVLPFLPDAMVHVSAISAGIILPRLQPCKFRRDPKHWAPMCLDDSVQT